MPSQYPASIDNTTTLPLLTDSVSAISATNINILRNVIVAIETELGAKPSGIYSTVKARLDAIDAAIQSISGGGSVSFGGDLTGTVTSQTVVGLQGRAISASIPQAGQTLIYNGAWTPGTNFLAQTLRTTGDGYFGRIFTSGDGYIGGNLTVAGALVTTLTGDVSGTTTTTSVDKWRGKSLDTVTMGSPTDGYIPQWVNAANKWEAKPTDYQRTNVVTLEQFGAVGNGVTNDSAAMTAALAAVATGGTIQLGAKTYLISTSAPYSVPAFVCIAGHGDGSVIKTTTDNAVFIAAGDHTTFLNFKILGSGLGATSQIGIANQNLPASANTGFHWMRIDGVTFDSLGAAGILTYQIPAPIANVTPYFTALVSNSRFWQCGRGLWFLGEYSTAHGNQIDGCTVGIECEGGNQVYIGGTITTCTTGFKLDGGGNDAHGVICGMEINHNTTNIFVWNNEANGAKFVDCMIYSGDILLQSTHAAHFINCHIDVPNYYFDGSIGTMFDACTFPQSAGANTIHNNYNDNTSTTRWSSNNLDLNGNYPQFIIDANDGTQWQHYFDGYVTASNMAGFGDGYVAVNNSGKLRFTSTIGSTGITPGTAGQLFVTNATPASVWTSLATIDLTHGNITAGGSGSDASTIIGTRIAGATLPTIYLLNNGVAAGTGNWALQGDGTNLYHNTAGGAGSHFFYSANTQIASIAGAHGFATFGGSGSDYKVAFGPDPGAPTSAATLHMLPTATTPTGSNYVLLSDGNITALNAVGSTLEFQLGTGSVWWIQGTNLINWSVPNFEWTESLTPLLYSDPRTGDNPAHDFTIRAQYPYSLATLTNRTPGSIVFDIGAPTNSSTTEAYVKVTRNNLFLWAAGANPSAPGSQSMIWLGPNITPTQQNCVMVADGSSFTYMNAPNGGALGWTLNDASFVLYGTGNNVYYGGTSGSSPLLVDWSAPAAPTIHSGTAGTSLSVGTKNTGAALFLQADNAQPFAKLFNVGGHATWNLYDGGVDQGAAIVVNSAGPTLQINGPTAGTVQIFNGPAAQSYLQLGTTDAQILFPSGNQFRICNNTTAEFLRITSTDLTIGGFGTTASAPLRINYTTTTTPIIQSGTSATAFKIGMAAAVSNVATGKLTIQGQYAFSPSTGGNRKSGNIAIDVGPSTDGYSGTDSEAALWFTRNGSTLAKFQPFTGGPADFAIYPGTLTPSSTNYAWFMSADGTSQIFGTVATGNLQWRVGNSVYLLVDDSGPACTLGKQASENINTLNGALEETTRTKSSSFALDTSTADRHIFVTATLTMTLSATTINQGHRTTIWIDTTSTGSNGSDIILTIAPLSTEKINGTNANWVITVPGSPKQVIKLEMIGDGTNVRIAS